MYENLSLLYDEYMADVDYSAWASYLLGLVQKEGLNPLTALELGCGSGSLTIPLSNKLSITGVDLSEEMLTLAEQKSRAQNKKITYLKGDMREFVFPEKVDLIICACETINCLMKDEIESFFKLVLSQLNEDGIFLFDMVTSHYLKDFIATRPFIFQTDDLTFIWESELKQDTIDFYFTYFIQDGQLYRKEQDSLTESIFSKHFIEKSLRKAGFKEIKTYAFLTQNNNLDNVDRIQFVVRK